MQAYEYKVLPAPAKGAKAKGIKTPEARFANSIELLLNEMASEGWEFLRADMLPSEERAGLTGSTTNWRNLLVFRRPLGVETSGEVTGRQEPAAPAVSFRHSDSPPLAAAPDNRETPPLRKAEPARLLGAAREDAPGPAGGSTTGASAAEAQPDAQEDTPGTDAPLRTPGANS